MQGLYKKVLKGIYPKIPSVFSSDMVQIIKIMVQVQPAMRPNCEKILELPFVKEKIEKLFPEDFFSPESPKMDMLNTVRIPKNLLYLTDRLPKPDYGEETLRKMNEEKVRRRTYENSEPPQESYRKKATQPKQRGMIEMPTTIPRQES